MADAVPRSRRRAGYAAAIALIVLAGGLARAGEPDGPRRQALRYLLYQDCGACHGMTLRGGLGPPLLPGALAAKSESALLSAVLDGRPGTPMPPWRGLLTEDEARWLVGLLRRGDAR